MRVVVRILSALTAMALLAAGGPALYCVQASDHAMPCCKGTARCDLGMNAAPCCAVEPSSDSPEKSAGSEARKACAVAGKRPQAVSPHAMPPVIADPAAPSDGPLWHPPPHDGSPSLYLRNNSILR